MWPHCAAAGSLFVCLYFPDYFSKFYIMIALRDLLMTHNESFISISSFTDVYLAPLYYIYK